MKKKWLNILNVFVLILIILILIFLVWNFSFEEKVSDSKECVDVNKVASFVYDSCYDAYSKNIFLEVSRSYDLYNLKALKVSFFDFSEKSYRLEEVPNTEDKKSYKISAEKNPQTLNIVLDIVKDFSAPICKEPRKLFVKYCPVGISEEGVNTSISPLKGSKLDDFIEIKSSKQNSDILSLNLVEKERIWKSKCESRWECDSWESCEDGVQRRNCEDKKECFIPTNLPETVKYCDGVCVEDWECEWSKCVGGFTVPKCNDLNRCGTSFNIPKKLKCAGASDTCVSDIECDSWSECDINYNFIDLVGNSINELKGSRSRVCRDKNSCAEPTKEIKDCAANLDIYTKRIQKCGTEFIGVYNRLDDSLLVRIEKGTSENPYLNIRLDDSVDEIYCDYCFDGVLNGDEAGVDCGGSCKSCEDKYRRISYQKKTWFDRMNNWFKKLIVG